MAVSSKMFKFLIVATIMLFQIDSIHAKNDLDILKLDQGWKFCPTQSYSPNADISELTCHPISLPGGWESVIPNYDGYGLLYQEFTIDNSFSKNALGIYFDRIRDADKVFINGIKIGETGNFPPNYEKAVFYSRLYSIPLQLLKFNQTNNLSIWVYNGARPGGIMVNTPYIGFYQSMVSDNHNSNYISFAFIVILVVFSVIHLINFIFNISSKENLYYSMFLLAWSAYILSSNNLALILNVPLNALFRLNVILFFSIFSLFVLFIFSFFKQQIPIVLQICISVALLCIPISIFLPELKQLYFLVSIVELLTIPSLVYVVLLLINVIKKKFEYSKVMAAVVGIYIIFGISEIIQDYFIANEAASYSPLGPWVLIIITLVLTFIVGHKNMSYYHKATFDGLTGILRFENFTNKLKNLLVYTANTNQAIGILMVDLDDFKLVNDKYGHILGDKVLILLTKTMNQELAHNDLLARYGGDEFCLAITRKDSSQLKEFIHLFHEKLNNLTLQHGDEVIQIHTTIGAAILSKKLNEYQPENLVEVADNLLIKAKKNSKGKVNIINQNGP